MEQGGNRIERTRGTPQGGVISPILSNLFLHYTFDLWMRRAHPDLPWCRYADDGLVHCRTAQEAEALEAELQVRLAECRLELHPTKTKIVYCKDGKRKGMYPNVGFDFLGYGFRPRLVRSSRNGELFCSFTPAVSSSALKAMRATNPVIFPAPLTRGSNRVQGRFPRSVAVGVWQEYGIQIRLYKLFDHHLRDTIAYGGHT